jgi:hypothetical protein
MRVCAPWLSKGTGVGDFEKFTDEFLDFLNKKSNCEVLQFGLQ